MKFQMDLIKDLNKILTMLQATQSLSISVEEMTSHNLIKNKKSYKCRSDNIFYIFDMNPNHLNRSLCHDNGLDSYLKPWY